LISDSISELLPDIEPQLQSEQRPLPPVDLWLQPEIIQHTQRLCASYQHWAQVSLLTLNPSTLNPGLSPEELSCQLFAAPFVLLSHGGETDPILNYGNRTALELWDYDWDAFTRLPSRLTAEPQVRAERAELLAAAAARGMITGYRGVRVTRTGRRFWIEDAMIWDVLDAQGRKVGQAARFDRWQFLDQSQPLS
jgi:hypothetical protein